MPRPRPLPRSALTSTAAEWDDIARYLDATRAELVFARRVLLVEGYAEQVLIPVIAKALDIDLDKRGISVCAIHGTHFGSYARFCDALRIPWAVITDGDKAEDGASRGERRAQRIMEQLEVSGSPYTHGVFVGDSTFEYDLLKTQATNVSACLGVLRELGNRGLRKRIEGWDETIPAYEDFMRAIGNIGGKGRFAQRLALKDLRPPAYVAAAIEYLTDDE